MRLLLFSLLLLLPAAAQAQLRDQARPNILYILIDNWGWGDIGVQGGSIPTPEIDQLAADGLRLTNFNVENQCTPTRSAIMTGRLPIRSGTHRVTYGQPYGMAPWEFTLAELLNETGYDTALLGKWHLGDVEGRLPTDQGFDYWYGIRNTTDEAGYSSTPQYDPEIVPQPFIWEADAGSAPRKVAPFDLDSRRQIDREIIERAEAYLADPARAEAPFFLMTALTQIHPPLGTHPDFANVSGHGLYSDIITELDANIGRILAALDEAGLADDTIVILTGDNGAVTDGIGGGSNGPWRAGFTGYEGGLRTPAMVRWPGTIEAGRVSDEIFAALDWMPTLATLAGAPELVPDDRPIDGLDASDFLTGASETSPREHVVVFIGDDLFSVKWRSFKIHLKTAEDLYAPVQEYLFPPVYDVAQDPGEENNLMKFTLFAHSWVYVPLGRIVGELTESFTAHPNIPPGAEFEGYPEE